MPPDTIAPALFSDLSTNLLANPAPPELPPPDIQVQLQGLRTLRQTVVLWLIALGLAGLTVTLTLVAATLQDDIAQTEAELQSIQFSLTRLSTPSAEVQALTATLTQTLALAADLAAVQLPIGVDWPAVMRQVGNYNSTQLLLTDLIQENNRITLNGEAVDSTVVTAYRRTLEASALFTRVVIQSIKVIEPAAATTTPPVATPAITPMPAPTAPSATAVAFVIIMELSQ